MIWIGKAINKNYGWELSALYNYRSFSDGIDFFEFRCDYNKFESDHNPSFNLKISILNFTLIEFNVYYLHHRE